MLPRSLSCRLEAGQPDEGHRGRNGQGPDVFQQSPRQAEEADDHFYEGGHDDGALDLERERAQTGA